MGFVGALRSDMPSDTPEQEGLGDAIREAAKRHAHQAGRAILSGMTAVDRTRVNSYVLERTVGKIDAGAGAAEIKSAREAVEFLRHR